MRVYPCVYRSPYGLEIEWMGKNWRAGIVFDWRESFWWFVNRKHNDHSGYFLPAWARRDEQKSKEAEKHRKA